VNDRLWLATSALLVGLLMLGGTPVHAQEARGFAEFRGSWFAGTTGTRWQLIERVRPSFEQSIGERLQLVGTVEAGLAQGRNAQAELERVLEPYGVPAAEYANPALRLNGSDDYLEVDRLYLDVYGNSFDLRVGRQALNWGSAQFFNPTDPFPEVLFTEPWRPRQGVNAIRLNVPFGDLHDVSAVVATNGALNELRAAGRVRLNWEGTDFALVGAWRGGRRNGLVGIDVRGTLGVGWWLEAAWLLGRDPHEEVSVGVDYSFPVLEQLTVFAQYHRNGAGTPAPTGPGFSLESGAERDPFAPFTRGRDYAMFGSTLGVLPDLSGSVFALQNLNDGSGLVVPTASWAVLDWLEIAASAQVPFTLWGAGGELKPRPEDLRIELPGTLPEQPTTVELGGLIPASTFTLWTRASF
jgi:hypothetical protein